jgi:hypothetical protein
MSERFRVFPQFADPALAGMIRSRHRLGDVAAEVFAGDRLEDRLVRALADRRVLNTKEVLESFAFWHRVRRRVRRPTMLDLCCGHGLTGVLFAVFERTVERVILVDHRQPESVAGVLEAAASVAPWCADKLLYREEALATAKHDLPHGAGVVGVHACGEQTDRVLDVALATGGPVAVMPCCYRSARRRGPVGVADALGTALAIDVHRSYRLDAAGRQVDWTAIPAAITPMNRVLIGWSPR